MNSRTDVAQRIRLDPPPIEADPVFVARLAGLATASRPSPTPDRRGGGLRIAAAAAGVLAVTAGAAVAAQHLANPDGPQPVHRAPVSPDVTRTPDRATDGEGDGRHDDVRHHDGTAHRDDGDHTGVDRKPTGAAGPGEAPTTGIEPGDDGHESDGASTSPTGSGTPDDSQGDDQQGDDQQGSGQGDQGDSGTGSGDSGRDDNGGGGNDGAGDDTGSDDPTSGASAGDASGDGDLGVAIPDTGDGDGGQTDH